MNHIFYHLYHYGDCEQRFEKTLKKIKDSGLYDNTENIHVNLVGKQVPSNLLNGYDSKIKKYNIVTNSVGEMDTLRLLWDITKILPPNDNVLYLHCKGVTKPDNRNVQAWTDYMEYFLIEKWEDVLKSLETHDTCGVNLQTQPMLHYSGNFWWAKAGFIHRTKRYSQYYSSFIRDERNYCEFWLLDHKPVNPACLHISGVHHYNDYYDESNYRKD